MRLNISDDVYYQKAQYNKYLSEHIGGVLKAYNFLCKYGILDYDVNMVAQLQNHDKSKYSVEEFDAYRERFYGKNKNKREDSVDFKYAWLHHQHNNPHHWQHWCLKEDDSKDLEALEMPYNYIIEMICDWWSFSINRQELDEIFGWYDKNKNKIILHKNTRKQIEEILDKLKEAIANES